MSCLSIGSSLLSLVHGLVHAEGSSSTGGSGEGIHQSGTQTNDDARTLDVQTEDISMAHKQMQFYLSDDTDFLDALKKAAATREAHTPTPAPLQLASTYVPGWSDQPWLHTCPWLNVYLVVLGVQGRASRRRKTCLWMCLWTRPR